MYNFKNEPMYCLIFNEEERSKKEADESWKVHSIQEVKDFVLTHHGAFAQYDPMLLVIEDNEMYVYDFTVRFISKDCFEIKRVKRKIALSYNDILRYANNCEYPRDPLFDNE